MKNILAIAITVVLFALVLTTQFFASVMTMVGNGTTLLGNQNAVNAEASWKSHHLQPTYVTFDEAKRSTK
jgi:predicted PurR-regulated permease PerM